MSDDPFLKSPRKRGHPLTYEEKWMVKHVFESLEKVKPHLGTRVTKDNYQLTSDLTGISRTIVANIIKSVRQTGQVPIFHSPGNRNQATAIPSLAEGRIREFIFEQHHLGVVCNAKHIQSLLKEEYHLEISDRTVRRHLNRMGFSWGKSKQQLRSLRESALVRQQRHDYLYELRKNRERPLGKFRKVVYIDESFLHHHHASNFSWLFEGDVIERPSGKGRRWCFIHALMEDGLVEGAYLIFEAKNSKGDYHQQFDFQRFYTWFKKQLLPNLSSNCLIVLDRCSFHRVSRDQINPNQMTKAELRTWLLNRNLLWEEKWLRARLIEEVEKHRDQKTMVESLAETHGHQILFLPVHHPELNPIELVWATLKNNVARSYKNTTSFKEQRQHLEESFQKDITPAYCAKLYQHVQTIEKQYWQTDLILDSEFDSSLAE